MIKGRAVDVMHVLSHPDDNEVDFVFENFRDRCIMHISNLLNKDNYDFKFLSNESFYSDWKELPNFKFRLMFFPLTPHLQGSKDLSDYKISAYVEAAKKDDWPENWICFGVRFCVYVINASNLQDSIFKKDTFNFSCSETDRGWQGIISYASLLKDGFLDSYGNLNIRAGAYPIGAEIDKATREHNYNSKECTGYVGLQNHGATCYMNALLQSLYSIVKFRSAVYKLNFYPEQIIGPRSLEILKRLNKEDTARRHVKRKNIKNNSMDIDDNLEHVLDEGDSCDILMEEEYEKKTVPSVGLALQNLFYKLAFAPDAPPCKELMRSFGWDSSDMFTQQDSHELLKLLLDKMEEQMKGTPAEGSVKEIFEGEMETYIECINVNYKSSRKETFEDIQLDVQGCRDIYESLEKLTEAEILDGDNMYEAEGHGKQAARKGIRLLKCPPVMIFLLKRFTFDLQRMDTVKLNNRFEFYKEIDLSCFCPGAEKYVLQAVAVHHGSINSGHYYAMAASSAGKWYRFDDDVVVKVSEYAAIGDNFGGEEPDCYNYLSAEFVHSSRNPPKRHKVYNAYILIYVDKKRRDEVLGEIDVIAEHSQMIQRCRMMEQLQQTRQKIRERLSKFIKLTIFEVDDFAGIKFMDQPFVGWEGGKTYTLDRSCTISNALNSLNLQSSKERKLDSFHIMGLNRHLNRFYCLADLMTRFNNNKDAETLQDLTNMIRRDLFQMYDPTLYILYAPRRGCYAKHCLFLIKYFDVFSPRLQQESLYCLDVLYLDLSKNISQVNKIALKRLLEFMTQGLVTPNLVQDIRAFCASESNELPPILQLNWYLELNNSYEQISTTKTLGEQQLANGDLLVCNFRPTETVRKMIESRNRINEDFGPTMPAIEILNEPFHVYTCLKEYGNINFNSLYAKWKQMSLQKLEQCDRIDIYTIYDFPSFVDYRLNITSVIFKVFDPLECLGAWKNCSGAILASSNINSTCYNEQRVVVDLRVPCKFVLKYACWKLSIDPAHVLLYPSSTHLLESIWTRPMHIDDFSHKDNSLSYVQQPLSELFSCMGIIIKPHDIRDLQQPDDTMISWPGSIDESPRDTNIQDSREESSQCNSICLAVLPVPSSQFISKLGNNINCVCQVFNNRVEVTAAVLVSMPFNATIADLCRKIQVKMNLEYKLRLIECYSGSFVEFEDTALIASLSQYTSGTVRNLFAAPLRLEPDWTQQQSKHIQSGLYKKLVVYHQTPDYETFGHAFQVLVQPTWTLSQVKGAIRDKLCVDKKEWDRWSFFQIVNSTTTSKTWKANENLLDWDKSDNVQLLIQHLKPYEKSKASFGAMKIM